MHAAQVPLGRGGFWGVAFEDNGVLVEYPFQSFRDFGTGAYDCPFPGYSGPRGEKRGYDPRCRPWYLGARSQQGAFFTAPYLFAGTTDLGITAALSFFNTTEYPAPTRSTPLDGVCMLDFAFTEVTESVQQKILSSGYGYIINAEGDAVAHPSLSYTSPPADPSILAFEFGSSSSPEAQAFAAGPLASMRAMEQGSAAYSKDGAEWIVAWGNVSSAGYSIALTVPQSEVEEPFAQAKREIDAFIGGMTGIIIATLCVLFLILVYAGSRVVQSIVTPVQRLNDVVQSILDKDFDGGFPLEQGEMKTQELALLAEVFRQMYTVVKVGHASLLGGDLEEAQQVYGEALELFTRMGHAKGMGVCYTNLGAAALLTGQHGEAIGFFTNAVQNAEQLLQAHEAVLLARRQAEGSAAPVPQATSAATGAEAVPPPPSQHHGGQGQEFEEVSLDGPGAAAPAIELTAIRVPPLAPLAQSMAAAAGTGGITPAGKGDEKHAKLLQQLASRQQNLAKAYLARAHVITDSQLTMELGQEVPDSLSAARAALGPHATHETAVADTLCALDVLDAAGQNYAAAMAALPPAQEAMVHAEAAQAFSQAALACATFPQCAQRARQLAHSARAAQSLFMALYRSPGFQSTPSLDILAVQVESRVLTADAAAAAAEGNASGALQGMSAAQVTGSVGDPAFDARVAWAMAHLLHTLGQGEAAKATLASGVGGVRKEMDLMFVLDYSGSMSGGLIRAAVSNMLMLYDNYTQARDRVGLILFGRHAEIHTELQVRGTGSTAADLRARLASVTHPRGTTACYDALHLALDMFKRTEGAGASAGRTQTIVALTDGEDNSSDLTPREVQRELAEQWAGPTQLVMVGVGRLRTADTLKDLCAASQGGLYVEAEGGASSLDAAFTAVAQAIADVTVESL